VTDLIVTAVRTSALLTASARQAAEQSLRAVQGEILRQISTAVLVDPALDGTLAAITEQLQQGAGYERVQVLLDADEPVEQGEPGRAVFPLVAQGRHLGALVIETARELDPSERELLRMFSESVALIVRNANLHGELSEAKSFLENLIQSATESIVAVDRAGRVVSWNPAA
jgi:GAF domain-containing protein